MARYNKSERRRERALRELAAKGWTAFVVGLLMLTVMPSLFRGPLASVDRR